MNRLALITCILACAAAPALAVDDVWSFDTATASTFGSHLPTYACDGDTGTYWSTGDVSQAQDSNWIWLWYSTDHNTYHPTNYIRLAVPLGDDDSALGFPVEFAIYILDSSISDFRQVRGFTHYPKPSTKWVTLPLDTMVNTNAIMIKASVRGDSMASNYSFRLSEVTAGYNDTLDGLEHTLTDVATSSEIDDPTWYNTNLIDGDPETSWSSDLYGDAYNSEWCAYWFDMQAVNYIKLKPRFSGSNSQCFPKAFTIYYSDGAHWVNAANYTHFATPHRPNDSIILPLPQTFTANGILIVATELGTDDDGNFAFQMAEAGAGYNPAFDQFEYLDNNDSAGRIEIENMGSESFDRPEQVGNFNFDARSVVINALPYANDSTPPPFPNTGHHWEYQSYRNIFAPSIVNTGGSSWNIYFAGWDGGWKPIPDAVDRISMTTTHDNFLSFSPHSMKIDGHDSPGYLQIVNNPNVVKTPSGVWRMIYTGCVYLCTIDSNRTAYATSLDGVNWSPDTGNTDVLIKMSGYRHWTGDNINGSNVLYWDGPNNLWHYFFVDDTNTVHHAHASAVEDTFTYDSDSTFTTEHRAINDLKSFSYGGTTYYMATYNNNTSNVWTTVTTDFTTLVPVHVAFPSFGIADTAITSSGWVQDGSRIYGILYGAGPNKSCFLYPHCDSLSIPSCSVPSGCDSALEFTANRIYARWLQKKVIFQNENIIWGEKEHGYGPDIIRLYMAGGDNIETGRFYVYDTDGQTLLYRSPVVTMQAGDIWRYSPRSECGR